MKKQLLFLVLVISGLSVFAQSNVSGTVSDAASGDPLVGVAVSVVGTTNGVMTDIDGMYKLNGVAADAVIRFSSIGFTTKEVVFAGEAKINVSLEANVEMLEDVIVTGYGNITKEAFTGSAKSVKGETLMKAAAPVSVEKAMQGYVAGVRIGQSDGQPGSAASVQVRGIGSINGNKSPLYVVDGLQIATGDFTGQTSANTLSSINPNDIKTMTVLKDAAATSLYGSKGANGVIVITTKSGAKGKDKVSVKVEYGVSDFAMKNEVDGYFMSGKELTEYTLEALTNYYLYAYDALPGMDDAANYDSTYGEAEAWAYSNLNTYGGLIHPDDNLDGSFDYSTADKDAWTSRARDTKWADLMFKQGSEKKIDVSISGGKDKNSHYYSLGYLNQEGNTIGSVYERFTGKVSLKGVVGERFKYSVSEAITYSSQMGATTGGTYYINPYFGNGRLNPTAPVFLDEETNTYNPTPGFSSKYPNYINLLEKEYTTDDMFRSMTNATFEFKLTEDLSVKSTNGIDFMYNYTNEVWEPDSHDGRSTEGYVFGRVYMTQDYTTSNILNYTKELGEDKKLNALVGFEASDYTQKYISATGNNFASSKLMYLSNGATPAGIGGSLSSKSMVSYLAKVDYSQAGKYYASASIRRDGSSKLAEDARWGDFWSTSLGWTASEEEFFTASWIDNLKVKASYGTNGNLPSGYYDSQALYSVSGSYDGAPAASLSSKGNPMLSWETTYTFNGGIDFRLFNSILTGSIEYYNKTTKDLLTDATTSATTGFTSQQTNLGELKNTGYEIAIGSTNIDKSDFRWTTDFNITYMEAKIQNLKDEIISFPYTYREGEDLYAFYLREWAGVDSATGEGLWYNNGTQDDGTIDRSTTTSSSVAQKTIVGKGYPSWYGGISNNFEYKGFELSFLFTFTMGGDLYDSAFPSYVSDGANVGSMNLSKEGLDHWKKPGDVSDNPRVVYSNPQSTHYNSDRRLKNSDHARLKNFNVAYNLPSDLVKKAGFSNVRLYVQGTNLLTFYKYDYINPEVGTNGYSRSNNYGAPINKTWRFGANIQF